MKGCKTKLLLIPRITKRVAHDVDVCVRFVYAVCTSCSPTYYVSMSMAAPCRTQRDRKRDRMYKNHKHTPKYKDLKRTIQQQLRTAYWNYVNEIVTSTDDGTQKPSYAKKC